MIRTSMATHASDQISPYPFLSLWYELLSSWYSGGAYCASFLFVVLSSTRRLVTSSSKVKILDDPKSVRRAVLRVDGLASTSMLSYLA